MQTDRKLHGGAGARHRQTGRTEMEDDSMKTIEERFLTYVAIDTQSEDGLETVPSTPKQRDLGELLVKELRSWD